MRARAALAAVCGACPRHVAAMLLRRRLVACLRHVARARRRRHAFRAVASARASVASHAHAAAAMRFTPSPWRAPPSRLKEGERSIGDLRALGEIQHALRHAEERGVDVYIANARSATHEEQRRRVVRRYYGSYVSQAARVGYIRGSV